ncbi:MAG: polysaccharide transporter ATP-binding protein [Paenibacillaceae bacterium]|jgi:putative aldouronate transport system permease protein|nr:polysaccharide transporter ATP-binding protein [Paenibacillaceae bacterium]
MVKPSMNATASGSRYRRALMEWRKNKYLYILALPGLLYFFVFKYIPMAYLGVAFQDYSPYKGILGSSWVGFEHFTRLFASPDFMMILRNTLCINMLSLFLFFPFPIVVSLLLNEIAGERFKKIIQTIIYMPHFLAWSIIAGITMLMFSQTTGFVNHMLSDLGFEKIDLLTNPSTFWLLLVGQMLWKEAGWGTVLILAAMSSIDTQLYEAAKIDGAGRLRQIWNVTLPGISNVIVILLVLRLGNMMDVGFEQIFLMQNAAVSSVSEVFDTYVYRVGVVNAQFSFTTAVGLFKSVVAVILVTLSNRLAKQFGEEGAF